MALVRAACSTMAFCARIKQLPVGFGRNRLCADGLKVAGPTCATVKLMCAGPKRCSTSDAMIGAGALFIIMGRGEWALSPFFSGDLILFRRKYFAPLRIGFFYGEGGRFGHEYLLMLAIRGQIDFSFKVFPQMPAFTAPLPNLADTWSKARSNAALRGALAFIKSP